MREEDSLTVAYLVGVEVGILISISGVILLL